ncbi:MAG: BamA/TamA family outer membrane protein [Sphingobacteriales bacterium]|nr:BamA/TamA family outer membrane protein [Sphingobacteriales bacterium]
MKIFRLQISVLVLLLASVYSFGQNKYNLHVHGVDNDSAGIVAKTGLQVSFPSYTACAEYINKLPGYLQSKGFVTASIDSLNFDSSFARITIFLGELYQWALLDVKNIETAILDAVGWREKMFAGKPINFEEVQQWQEKILNRMENTGYPFARVYLDSLQLDKDRVSALLKINKGPLYRIDSIRLYGNAKISNNYLQRYLDIPNGSLYSKEKLFRINKKIRELTYVEEERPFDIALLGTGSVLNLYLKQKKSSQVNALIGFLPNNDQLSTKKVLITGEANILLKNALGAGETIGLNWQQVQVKSPRLSLLYQHPYLFTSPVGLDFSFDMYKKDSAYLNIDFQLGVRYSLHTSQSGKFFLQWFQTIVSEGGINTGLILLNRRLPNVGDVNYFNVGFDYDFNNTDYRLNPGKGNEIRLITTVGAKKLKKNNQILELKDPNDPGYDFEKLYDTVKLNTYQFRIRTTAVRYWPLGAQRNTIKTALNGGMFQSGNTFRNELFQIGGYKLLRGFDEESQYLSHFIIATAEYHYLVGQNSYFYVLTDGGWGQSNIAKNKINYAYFGAGLGMVFETKAGIFNLAWAVGKRNDTQLNLRQSKIHIGFVNYF